MQYFVEQQAIWKGAIALMYPSDYGYSSSYNNWLTELARYDNDWYKSSWFYQSYLKSTIETSFYAEQLISLESIGSDQSVIISGNDGLLSALTSGGMYASVYIRPTLNLISSATMDINYLGDINNPYVLIN